MHLRCGSLGLVDLVPRPSNPIPNHSHSPIPSPSPIPSLWLGRLAELVDARCVDGVDPALVQVHEEDDVVPEARQAVRRGHLDDEGEH